MFRAALPFVRNARLLRTSVVPLRTMATFKKGSISDAIITDHREVSH